MTKTEIRYKDSASQRHCKKHILSCRTRFSKHPRHLSGTDTSAWRHRAFSPCASFLFEEGKASGCKRTPCRQGFRHRVHNNTNTLCLLFPTRAACMSINDLEFWKGKGTKSVPEGCAMLSKKTSVRYKEPPCEALQKTNLCHIELTCFEIQKER